MVNILNQNHHHSVKTLRDESAEPDHYRALVEASSLIVWKSDPTGHKSNLNGWAELTGQTQAEANDEGWQKVVHPDDRERVIGMWLEARATSSPMEIEFRVRARDGTYREVTARAVPIKQDDEVIEWIGAIFDVSESKQITDALIESESRFRAMFEHSGSGLALVDLGGHLVKSNPALQKLLGFSEQELAQMAFTEYTHPDDSDLDWALFNELVEGENDKYEIEKRFITRNGRTIWASLVSSIVRDPDGGPLYAIKMVQDITERKTAEAELRSSEERFAKAFHASPEPISIYRHHDGQLLEVNQRWTEVYGYQREEVIGQVGVDLTVATHADRMRIRKLMDEYGSFRNAHIDLTTKDGKIRNISLSAEQILVNGELCNLYLHHDITAQKRAEQENRQLIQDLGERVKELTVLHHTARLLEEHGTDLTAILSKLACLLPSAFQFPKYTAARVRLGKHQAATTDFVDSKPKLQTNFKTADGLVGSIEIVFTKDGPSDFKGWYLSEERALLETLAEMLRADYDRRKSEEQLRLRSSQLRALAGKLRSAREEEGIRIARELHDELGSALTSVKWSLMRLGKNRDSSDVQTIQEMAMLIDNTINSVRRISSELRPSVLDDLGLVSAIEWHGQQFRNRTGLRCRVDSLTEVSLQDDQATAVFRIFQEGLTNVLRHANASEVSVLLFQDRNEFVLEVRDNGRGITDAESLGLKSLGILGMRERAQAVGGEINILGQLDQGTVLTLRIPLSGATDR
ncbi:MAG TPA: PAS domain S-box protein [Pyrinomonadaceae bacterium]